MSEGLEFKGKSVAKALALASKALGIAPEKLQYDILAQGATGIFGLTGTRKAHIRVFPTPEPAGADSNQSHTPRPAPATENLRVPRPSETPEESAAQGEALIMRILQAISPEAQVKVESQGRKIRFNIHGGESGLLIGKHGQTLEAIQTLVEKAVRRDKEPTLRISVDIEGYHQKKRAGLIRNARRLAQRVKEKGQPASAGIMNAQDRRVIHLALKEDPEVRTQSKGEGYLRKLVIYPKRHTPSGER